VSPSGPPFNATLICSVTFDPVTSRMNIRPSRCYIAIVCVSPVLSRAEDFLPRLAASNAELANKAAQDPASVDIEHLGDRGEDAPHIEMNLGLGVFSQRPPPSAKRTSTSTSSPDPSPTLRSPATGTTAPTTLATYSSASSATTSSDEDDESDESNDEHSDDEDSDDGSVISALPPDEARALEALLSPRPIPSSRFQQQQQQQPIGGIPGTESADSAGPDAASQTEPEEQKAAGAGGTPQQGRKPSMVVLTSGMDIDMDTGPQTARGWEEE